MKTMHTQLRQLRKAAKMTQAMLAQATNLSTRDILNMESGSLSIPCGKYLAVADYFQVSINALLEKEA